MKLGKGIIKEYIILTGKRHGKEIIHNLSYNTGKLFKKD